MKGLPFFSERINRFHVDVLIVYGKFIDQAVLRLMSP
jgi:hypothetical protein